MMRKAAAEAGETGSAPACMALPARPTVLALEPLVSACCPGMAREKAMGRPLAQAVAVCV